MSCIREWTIRQSCNTPIRKKLHILAAFLASLFKLQPILLNSNRRFQTPTNMTITTYSDRFSRNQMSQIRRLMHCSTWWISSSIKSSSLSGNRQMLEQRNSKGCPIRHGPSLKVSWLGSQMRVGRRWIKSSVTFVWPSRKVSRLTQI